MFVHVSHLHGLRGKRIPSCVNRSSCCLSLLSGFKPSSKKTTTSLLMACLCYLGTAPTSARTQGHLLLTLCLDIDALAWYWRSSLILTLYLDTNFWPRKRVLWTCWRSIWILTFDHERVFCWSVDIISINKTVWPRERVLVTLYLDANLDPLFTLSWYQTLDWRKSSRYAADTLMQTLDQERVFCDHVDPLSSLDKGEVFC